MLLLHVLDEPRSLAIGRGFTMPLVGQNARERIPHGFPHASGIALGGDSARARPDGQWQL